MKNLLATLRSIFRVLLMSEGECQRRIEQGKFWKGECDRLFAEGVEAFADGRGEDALALKKQFDLAYRRFNQEAFIPADSTLSH